MINDLIFKELLKRGYHLEGKTRVWDLADSKLWYLTPRQAKGFVSLEQTKDYKASIIDKEISLIRRHLPDFLSELSSKSYNIIDLGCGDGKKAALFIEEFTKHLQIRYCPIDISAYFVNVASKEIRKLKIGDVLEFKWNISDFENLDNVLPLLRVPSFKYNFLMLFGNTMGNFDSEYILHEVKTSMTKGDVLLVGVGITDKKGDSWIKEYKDETINKWLVQVPMLLGIQEADLEYDVRFINSRIEEFYTLKRDMDITHLDKTISFKKGDVILVAISYKYSKQKLGSIMKKHFSEVKMFTDSENTYALTLCKK
ncbi:MAG TPA: L-histidine N(alpha)-methyltransferase [bacterium]|nr:L-histidine N(alpha)-methyltransferase [bacterium]